MLLACKQVIVVPLMDYEMLTTNEQVEVGSSAFMLCGVKTC